jgi:hypothetical protein
VDRRWSWDLPKFKDQKDERISTKETEEKEKEANMPAILSENILENNCLKCY